MNILVVDDDKVDRLTVRELLQDDFVVLEAESGNEVSDRLGQSDIDCVLLDYLIPGTDSLHLLSELAAKQLPVIILTGEGSEKIAVTAMKQGAQDYINKRNLTGELLSKTIANAVDTVGLRRKLAEKQSELVHANESLQHKVEELERLTEDLEDLIHITAHDLREPVRNFCNFCDLFELSVTGDLSEESKRHLESMRRNAKRLATLIDDLRALTRVVYENPESESIELSELVRAAMVDFQPELTARNAMVEVSALPKIRVIRQLMVQLYQNLIANALKYGSEGDLRIDITAEEGEKGLILGVRNNGSFIAPEDAEKVFQPFYRLPNSKQKEGTGMGLTLCRKIVERHGGRIWIESSPECGVHLKFILGSQCYNS